VRYGLGGTLELDWRPEGLRVAMGLPLGAPGGAPPSMAASPGARSQAHREGAATARGE
jgi:hypothetical protein